METINQKQKKINEVLFNDSGKPNKHKFNTNVYKYLGRHTKEIKYDIIKRHYTQAQVAKKYGVVQSTVSNFLKAFPKMRNCPSDKTLIRYYKRYQSFNKVGKLLHIPKTTVWNHLRNLHVLVRVNHHHKCAHKRLENNLDYYYNYLYLKKGYSILRLTKLLHMNHGTITKIFKKHHLATRSPHIHARIHQPSTANELLYQITKIINEYKQNTKHFKSKYQKCAKQNKHLKLEVKSLKKSKSKPSMTDVKKYLKHVLKD